MKMSEEEIFFNLLFIVLLFAVIYPPKEFESAGKRKIFFDDKTWGFCGIEFWKIVKRVAHIFINFILLNYFNNFLNI